VIIKPYNPDGTKNINPNKRPVGVDPQHLITGINGENVAVWFLREKGYKIVQTNYKNKLGEIDIIMQGKEHLIFVEVKTRKNYKFGRPVESVTPRKQKKIKNVATVYMTSNGKYPCAHRYDIVEVVAGEVVSHIINAF